MQINKASLCMANSPNPNCTFFHFCIIITIGWICRAANAEDYSDEIIQRSYGSIFSLPMAMGGWTFLCFLWLHLATSKNFNVDSPLNFWKYNYTWLLYLHIYHNDSFTCILFVALPLQKLNTGLLGVNFTGNDLNIEKAWLQGVTGCNVTIGIVDDGKKHLI